ncbi:unnamed protein product [Adineta steineri]|uniref:Uncharacterized protein n=2 Tax=Adineta steineri TaxID=433720 RepID=A0A819KEG2_9BILA|nr:unnamed protein product [Adineta steineri]CAF3948195.1 unnamed protein product [Adineta steineri]
MRNRVLSDERFSWRKEATSSFTKHCISKNQNAIDHHASQNEKISSSNQKENLQLLSTFSSSGNFTTDNPMKIGTNSNDKIDSHTSENFVIITRRSSKPSRHKSIQIITPEIRKRQYDRYINYRYRIEESQLYSLIISSNGVECYGINCQPSVYNSSYRCQMIPFEKSSLMSDHDIKYNMSYISLTNLQDKIDHEPNVSRRASYSQSTSHTLLHKTSLFLVDIFNKMTHEQRAQSIVELTKLHERISKSNIDISTLQRTTSLPNLSKMPTKLHSVTSLLSEKIPTHLLEMENKNLLTFPTEQKHIDKDIVSRNISLKEFNDKHEVVLNDVYIPESSDKHSISTPVKLMPLHESDLSKENIQISNNPSATSLSIRKSSSNTDSNELPLISELRHDKVSNVDKINTQLVNPLEEKLTSSSISTHVQLLNDENEADNSLNDVTDDLSQQDTIFSYKNFDNSFDFISQQTNKTKRTQPFLDKIDEVSQQSKSSDSHLKNIPIIDDDTSVITRTITASTNLTMTNNNDEQPKLNNEQVKRSSLHLARDSLELLRNNIPHHSSSNEQLTPNTNIDSTSHKRKSVLKSHLMSTDILSTPELISYIAIDEVKGDKRLMEKQMRRRSLTIGGGTIVSCTSPKPKRDSLTLLQERYSESMSPSHPGCYHLSSSDSKHVEFIREPGNTITPVLHIGRGMKYKHSSSKYM